MGDVDLDQEDFGRWWDAVGKAQLAEILYWRWDPLGMSQVFPNTRGEYDNYLDPIAARLQEGITAQELEAALLGFENGDMGLASVPIREEGRPVVAEFIADYWFSESVRTWRAYPEEDWRSA